MAKSNECRIFFVYAGDIEPNMYNKVTLRRDDIVAVFVNENTELPEGFKSMGGKQIMIEKEPITYNVLQALKELNDPKASAYFCGDTMQQFFEKQKEEVVGYCKKALAHNTFGVNKIPAGNYYKKQKDDGQMSMLEIGTEALINNKADRITTTDEPKPEKPVEEPKKHEESKPPQKKEVKSSEPPKKTVNLKELEDAISGNGHLDSDDLFMVYSKLDEAKNTLIALLMERFGDHVKKIAKENLPQKEIYDLSKLILKTDDTDDFNKSYKTMYPHTAVYLSDQGFSVLKVEAEYITDLSTRLYEDDVYDSGN